MLTSYQLAVLQEMGIGVLEARSKKIGENAEQSASTQVIADKSENQAQRLRERLNQKPDTVETASQEIAIAESLAREDVLLALQSLALVKTQANKWLLDSTSPLSIAGSNIRLNVDPKTAKSIEKKAIWRQLVALDKAHNVD